MVVFCVSCLSMFDNSDPTPADSTYLSEIDFPAGLGWLMGLAWLRAAALAMRDPFCIQYFGEEMLTTPSYLFFNAKME